ncbi:MAG TPA: hypothetical protein VJ796_10145 [Acidimicrobiia bacterium]|nr:hypothetical protein [Acidimicrobiia bacterium]
MTKHNQHRQHGSTLENLAGLLGAAFPGDSLAATGIPGDHPVSPGFPIPARSLRRPLRGGLGCSRSVRLVGVDLGDVRLSPERWDGSSRDLIDVAVRRALFGWDLLRLRPGGWDRDP